MSFLTDFPQTRIVCETAKKKKTKVYLVGGFIRDHLLKRPCLDFDFAVEKDAISFAKLFARKIKGAFVLLDKERGCARVAKKSNGTLSTFDFADFRGSTLTKDLSGRDFTINTLVCCMNALDPSAELDTAIKDLKRGKYDIKAKRIRMVSVRAFKDDPLRLLRAFSLKAMLGFKIEEKTLRQIKKDRDLICGVSYERIRDELFKILQSTRAGETLKSLDRIGLLSRIIPQVEVMSHSLETVKQLDKILENMKDNAQLVDYINQPLSAQRTRASLMKLAALLHDIGKPDTRKKEPGRISFHAHERVGKSIARSIAKMLKLSTRERFALQDMVLWHLRPGYLSNFKQPSKRALFRYFRDTQDEAVSIALLSLADQRATRGPLTTVSEQKHHEKICLDLIGTYFKKREEKPFVRLINGDDLIKKVKLAPSPLFKIILDEVEEKQVMGKIKNKDEAIVLAGEIAKRKMQ
jgi:poly(A) polymerase